MIGAQTQQSAPIKYWGGNRGRKKRKKYIRRDSFYCKPPVLTTVHSSERQNGNIKKVNLNRMKEPFKPKLRALPFCRFPPRRRAVRAKGEGAAIEWHQSKSGPGWRFGPQMTIVSKTNTLKKVVIRSFCWDSAELTLVGACHFSLVPFPRNFITRGGCRRIPGQTCGMLLFGAILLISMHLI